MRIVVTAGPTREYVDDVRFLSNPSTGKMGFCIAAEAAKRGHSVRLLAGPVCAVPPKGVETFHFETVEELYGLVVDSLVDADCLIMAAAPGDYRPAERYSGKRKKTESLTIQLIAARDVLKSVAADKGKRIHVGFAVEVADALVNARKKLAAKSLDLLVLNSPASFGADRADFTFLFPNGEARPLANAKKTAVAAAILNEVEALFGAKTTS